MNTKEWKKCDPQEFNPVTIPGGKVKGAYRLSRNCIVTTGTGNKLVRFAVVEYALDGKPLYELKYKKDDLGPWLSFTENAIRSLLDLRGVTDPSTVKEVSGRYLVDGSINLTYNIEVHWRGLCYMFLYPDTIKNLRDAIAVYYAAVEVQARQWQLRGDTITKALERSRARLVDAKQALADYEREYDEICAKAAEAMNELSERFGIEVNVY